MNSQKLFFITLTAGIITQIVLAYFALIPLDVKTSDPQSASAEYLKFMRLFNKANMLIYAILIFLANLIFRNSHKGIFLFYGWLFFSATTLFSYIYLAEKHFHFKQQTKLWQGEFSVAGFAGIFLALAAAMAAIINYFVLKRIFKNRV